MGGVFCFEVLSDNYVFLKYMFPTIKVITDKYAFPIYLFIH